MPSSSPPLPRKPVPAATVLALLPIGTRSRVDELVTHLQKTGGAALQAIIAYGSVVRGGYDARTSDVDLLVVVDDDRTELLEAFAPALRLARAAARVEAVILRTDEIARGADVFPLFFDDVRGCHAVLHGRDVFAGLVVHDEHRRLRIEQELRDARLHLRALVAGGDSASDALLAAAIARLTKKLRSPLHALLGLAGRRVDDDVAGVLRAAGDTWGADSAWLMHPERDARAALRALRTLLDAAIDDADTRATAAGAAGSTGSAA